MRTYKDAKAMANSLRDSLATRSVSLSHSACLEIVAKQFGFADWNTLSAKLAVKPGPEPVTCSFCGKRHPEVLRVFEGACSNRGVSPCVFICNDCVAFCAQVDADLVASP
jgi:hypothetical protein